MAVRKILNIELSSMRLWIFKDGDMANKHRAVSNADGFVIIPEKIITIEGEYGGEEYHGEMQYVDYSDKHVVKLRTAGDGIDMEDKHYGKIIGRPRETVLAQNTNLK